MTMLPNTARRVVLLGDMRDLHHHGCEAVIAQIVKGLTTIGLAPTEILAGLGWRDHEAACLGAHLVVINGEGALHDSRPVIGETIALAEARRGLGRPTALINSSWFRNHPALARRLSAFDLITLRDSQSALELAAQGLNCHVVPDLAIRQAIAWKPLCMGQPPASIMVSDSTQPLVTKKLRKLARQHGWRYLPVLAQPLTQRPGAKSRRIHRRWRIGRWLGPLAPYLLSPRYHAHVVGVPQPDDYALALGSAGGVVTGRFHTVCMALGLEVPVLAVASNTPKIESVLADAGLDVERRMVELSRLNQVIEVPAYTDTERAALRRFLNHVDTVSRELFTVVKELTEKRS